MESIDNNQFEIKPLKNKRKIAAPCPNVYLNPALDLLVNEDPMCNTAMEIVPNKKRKRTRSCSDIAAFENSALDLGINKNTLKNQILVREIENVKKNVRYTSMESNDENMEPNEPIYANLTDVQPLPVNDSAITPFNASQTHCMQYNETHTLNNINTIIPYNDTMEVSTANDDIDSGISVLEQKSLNAINDNINVLSPITNVQTNITNQVFINNMNNSTNLNLSFIDRLALDSPNLSNQSLFYDDDLNESNIMEIKTITIITKKKRINTNSKNTNPFLDPNLCNMPTNVCAQNPFLNLDAKPELEYNEEALTRPAVVPVRSEKDLEPRRLFGDTNSTISTVNESLEGQHEYENVDNFRTESPVYENIDEVNDFNKQSRILGHDVSHFSAVDIMNLNKISQQDSSNDSTDSKNKNKHSFLKVGNKFSKKVFKTLKKTFKGEKSENNITVNPYEVPRKMPKQKTAPKESGIENPALNLDNSDEIEIEEIDEEHQYETVKTLRNTHLNMNITPLKERCDNADSSHNKTNTPGKKVRFDSTLNQEKVITGNSFDYDIQSPGFDVKLDKYHDELENCINERKFLQQNM